MNTLQPFAHFAATVGAAFALAQHRGEPAWARYGCPELGVSFEAPFPLETEVPLREGPFASVAQGGMALPFVFDVSYVVSREPSDALPEELTRLMAVQWAVDYRLASAAKAAPLSLPGMEDAWVLTADIEDGAGRLGSCWVTLRQEGRIACLSVSYWLAESQGHEAAQRLLGSISGV